MQKSGENNRGIRANSKENSKEIYRVIGTQEYYLNKGEINQISADIREGPVAKQEKI